MTQQHGRNMALSGSEAALSSTACRLHMHNRGETCQQCLKHEATRKSPEPLLVPPAPPVPPEPPIEVLFAAAVPPVDVAVAVAVAEPEGPEGAVVVPPPVPVVFPELPPAPPAPPDPAAAPGSVSHGAVSVRQASLIMMCSSSSTKATVAEFCRLCLQLIRGLSPVPLPVRSPPAPPPPPDPAMPARHPTIAQCASYCLPNPQLWQ